MGIRLFTLESGKAVKSIHMRAKSFPNHMMKALRTFQL